MSVTLFFLFRFHLFKRKFSKLVPVAQIVQTLVRFGFLKRPVFLTSLTFAIKKCKSLFLFLNIFILKSDCEFIEFLKAIFLCYLYGRTELSKTEIKISISQFLIKHSNRNGIRTYGCLSEKLFSLTAVSSRFFALMDG